MGGLTSSPSGTTPVRAAGIQFQTATYGPPLPVLYGRNRISGSVIDYLGFSSKPTHSGKGGGGQLTGYSYKCTFLVLLGEGPMTSINGAWDSSTPESLAAIGATAFLGTSTQNVWSYLAAGSHTLTYRYTAYCAFADKNLGSSPTLPNYNWDATGLLPYDAGIVDGADPSAILEDVCTNAEHGMGFDALGDLTLWSTYCRAADIFLSPYYNQSRAGIDLIAELCKYTNTAPFWSEGQLKFVPYGDQELSGNGVTYTPDLTPLYDLDDRHFITDPGTAPIKVVRTRPSDAYNQVLLEVVDSTRDFTPFPVEAKDQGDIEDRGLVSNGMQSAHLITDISVGRMVAQMLLQRSLYTRNQYQFSLPFNYSHLEQMDAVTLTDSWLGLDKFPVRLVTIEESADGSCLDIVAEEFPAGIGHAAAYGQQGGGGSILNLDSDPGHVQEPFFVRAPGFMVDQPEIWCAVAGTTDLWGGCHVYLSFDGVTYTYFTTITEGAHYGELSTDLPIASSDPDLVNTPKVALYNGTLDGATHTDADQFATASLIDQEVIAYGDCAPTAVADEYQLGYLRRAGYRTNELAHSVGAPFIRIDGNLVRIPFDVGSVGQTLHVKFVSFNIYRRGVEDISTVTDYTYDIGQNLEIPDQPPTPTDFDVKGVADGVKITFTLPNPGAVAINSIERSSDGGTTWVSLALCGSEGYTDHFTDGADYYYRVRSRSPDYVWSDYTVGMDAAGRIIVSSGDVTYNDLINNGDFELDAFWSGGTREATGGISDGPCYQLTAAAGATAIAKQLDSAGNQRYIPVTPGDRLYIPISAYRTAGDATPKVRLYGYDANKGSEDTSMTSNALNEGSAFPVTHSVFQVPDGVFFVTPAFMLDSDGTATTTCNFDNIHLYKNSFERSSVDVTVPTGFTYTSTTNSITWAWSGLTIYWADGSQTDIADGSQEFTGLTASTSYYAYPRYDLLTGTVDFGSGLLTARSYTEAQAQHAYTCIPLSSGAMEAATTSSGSGGGGGGGIGGCLHERTLVEIRRGDVVMMLFARDLRVGDEVWTDNGWQPILRGFRKSQPEFIYVRLDGGGEYCWTPEQPCRTWDGEEIGAEDLKIGSFIKTQGGNAEVIELRKIAEYADKVMLEIPAPHWFYQRRGGAEISNGTVKP